MSGRFIKRRNWTRSLTVVIIVAFISIGTSMLAQTDGSDSDTERYFLVNSAGGVLFDHGYHSGIADSCAICHHPLYSSEVIAECADCHDDEMNPEDFTHSELTASHQLQCFTCHEERSESGEIENCRTCHAQTSNPGPAVKQCSECHDDSFSADMMSHDEYLEIEEHDCSSCHSPGTVSEMYHLQCNTCHQEQAPESFTDKEGELLCGACHLL